MNFQPIHSFDADYMKIPLIQLGLFQLSLSCVAAPFRNLDFQSPNIRAISNASPGGADVNKVLPGWRLQIAAVEQSIMFYNNDCFSCPSAQLYGPEMPRLGDKFQFSMHTGEVFDPTYPISISQTGDIPSNARSVLFFGAARSFLTEWHFSLGGQELQIQEIRKMPEKYSEGALYGVDVSSWAGTTAELRFTAGPGSFLNPAGGVLADIHFSSAALPAIPEPSTWALWVMGLSALAWNNRRRG